MKFETKLQKRARILAIGICVLAGARAATAQTACVSQGQTLPFTYTSSFGTDGSAQASFTLSGDVLIVNFTNTSTSGTFLKGLAFNASPTISSESIEATTSTAGWEAGVGPGGGLGRYDLIVSSTGKNRLGPGSSATAAFILAAGPQTICIEKTIVALIALPNGDGEKPLGIPGTVGGGDGGDDDDDDPPID